MFATMKPYVARRRRPGLSRRRCGATRTTSRALLGDRVTDVRATQRCLKVDRFADPAAFRDYFKANYGPTIAAYRGIADDPDRVAALDQALVELGEALPYAGRSPRVGVPAGGRHQGLTTPQPTRRRQVPGSRRAAGSNVLARRRMRSPGLIVCTRARPPRGARSSRPTRSPAPGRRCGPTRSGDPADRLPHVRAHVGERLGGVCRPDRITRPARPRSPAGADHARRRQREHEPTLVDHGREELVGVAVPLPGDRLVGLQQRAAGLVAGRGRDGAERGAHDTEAKDQKSSPTTCTTRAGRGPGCASWPGRRSPRPGTTYRRTPPARSTTAATRRQDRDQDDAGSGRSASRERLGEVGHRSPSLGAGGSAPAVGVDLGQDRDPQVVGRERRADRAAGQVGHAACRGRAAGPRPRTRG